MTFKTRFAPSPTGHLHLGHAFSAITTWNVAQSVDAEFLLRIEDIDHTRCRPGFEESIFADLAWLGLSWPEPVIRQSARMERYDARLHTLIDEGLVYRCFKTRKEVSEIAGAPHGPTGAFFSEPLPPHEEQALIAEDRAFSWRLSIAACRSYLGGTFDQLTVTLLNGDAQPTEAKADPSRLGDVVLARKDAGTSYHLASVSDDIDQGITHISRGEDLRETADLHRLLYALFNASPPEYHHHRLVLGDDGKRLAKRDKAATLKSMREAGKSRDDVFHQIGLAPIR